jgi:hypothetical protein
MPSFRFSFDGSDRVFEYKAKDYIDYRNGSHYPDVNPVGNFCIA